MGAPDVVVIGAGVMGAAAAWRLAMAGRRVVLLEQFEVGHTRGSSHGASRIFRFSYDDPGFVRMAMNALPLWRELEETCGESILTVLGGVDFGRDLGAHAAALSECGAQFELLKGSEAIARFPGLWIAPDAPVLFQRDAGIVRADRAWRAFVQAAAARGAELREGSVAREIRPTADDRVEVGTDGETYRARVAVVTAGAWARSLLGSVLVDLPVTPSRETVAYFRMDGELDLPILVDWGEAPNYSLADPGRGIKAGAHRTGPEVDPDDEGEVDPAVVERLSAWVATHYPGAESVADRAETCLYTNTTDERFILERRGPIVVGSACSGHGFKFAPVIGERLARLAVAD